MSKSKSASMRNLKKDGGVTGVNLEKERRRMEAEIKKKFENQKKQIDKEIRKLDQERKQLDSKRQKYVKEKSDLHMLKQQIQQEKDIWLNRQKRKKDIDGPAVLKNIEAKI